MLIPAINMYVIRYYTKKLRNIYTYSFQDKFQNKNILTDDLEKKQLERILQLKIINWLTAHR